MKIRRSHSLALLALLPGVAVYAQTTPSAAMVGSSAVIAPDQASTSEASAPATSSHAGVRIVRLSQVRGQAQLDRNTEHGYQAAFANLPIQGAKLKTAEGVAEVEFEDNSTLRLAPDTVVEFPQLRMTPQGTTASTIHVLQGTVYVAMAPSKANEFNLTFDGGKIVVAPSTHAHFHVGAPHTALAVLDGTAQAEVATGSTTVGKKKTLVFDSANKAAPQLVSSIEKTPYDEWDKNSADYHKRVMNVSSFGSSTPLYGLNDMSYYGSFQNVGGCGSMWRPYFASASWEPYGNGIYAAYPGAGYSFVSPYPWGWTPYHTGSWQYCNGAGWGWMPGGNFVGLANLALPVNGGVGGRNPIRTAPVRGSGGLVPVSHQPLSFSKFSGENTFTFNKDSAGLGVPRQTFGKLSKVSANTIQHGAVSTVAYASPINTNAQAGHPSIAMEHAGSPSARSGVSNNTLGPAAGSMNAGRSSSASMSHTSMSSPSMSSGSHGGSMGGSSGGGHH